MLIKSASSHATAPFNRLKHDLTQQKHNKDLQKYAYQIYCDYQSTTPVDDRVTAEMLPTFSENFGNPHSRTHSYGWNAERLVSKARSEVADLIGAKPNEIVFTSGATEANNLAIKGYAEFAKKNKGKKHIITVETEHKSVLGPVQYLEKEHGWQVTYLPVNKDGLIDLNDLRAAITEDTALISVMLVNNEIGVIQPIEEITKIAHDHDVKVHCDAAQAIGKIDIDVKKLGVDMMSISGHKLYGPKGIGVLYVNSKPRTRLVPLFHGGEQERGLRSGTVPVSLCVGLGAACRYNKKELKKNYDYVKSLSDRFLSNLFANLTDITLNGHQDKRLPGSCNISFKGVEGESLIMELKDVAVSSGSACTSATLEPSYVLRSLGVCEELAHTSIRFSFGKYNSIEEIDYISDKVIKAVNKLREISPLWDPSGKDIKEQLVWK